MPGHDLGDDIVLLCGLLGHLAQLPPAVRAHDEDRRHQHQQNHGEKPVPACLFPIKIHKGVFLLLLQCFMIL